QLFARRQLEGLGQLLHAGVEGRLRLAAQLEALHHDVHHPRVRHQLHDARIRHQLHPALHDLLLQRHARVNPIKRYNRQVRLVALAMLFAGCAADPTTLLVDISVAPTAMAPASLRVSVYGPSVALADHVVVAAPSLPGRLVVRALPDVEQPLCVVVDGGAAGGAATVEARPHEQTELSIVLASSYALPPGCGLAMPDLGGGGGGDLSGPPDLAPVEKSCATLSHAVLLCDDFEGASLD